jgi:hypothetical protein
MNYVKSREGYARFITKLPGKVEDRIKRTNCAELSPHSYYKVDRKFKSSVLVKGVDEVD